MLIGQGKSSTETHNSVRTVHVSSLLAVSREFDSSFVLWKLTFVGATPASFPACTAVHDCIPVSFPAVTEISSYKTAHSRMCIYHFRHLLCKRQDFAWFGQRTLLGGEQCTIGIARGTRTITHDCSRGCDKLRMWVWLHNLN